MSEWFRKNVAWPFVLWARNKLRLDSNVSYDEYKDFVKASEELKPKKGLSE